MERAIQLVEILRKKVSSYFVCPMPLIKYFLYVGSALSLLLLAWSIYLEPPAAKVQSDRPSAKFPEVYQPTPAPPIEVQQLRVGQTPEPSAANPRSYAGAKIARTKHKKQATQVARRRVAPDRTFAYFPQRPFFFRWR
jgi:hypothetical protein